MAVRKLIENGQDYRGQFVATINFNDKTVIAHGVNPKKVMDQAQKKTASPVVFFVPQENTVHIY